MKIFSLVIGLFLFAAQDLVLAEAFIKNLDEKSSLEENSFRDHSSNQLPHSETVPSFADEYHHYLQMQTVFGSFISPSLYPAITAPPHINPTSADNSYEESSHSVRERKPYINDEYITPYQSHCVSETPLNEKLESKEMLSSQELVPESVILSGHTEIVSKTSNDGDASKISKMVSESSIPLEKTHIYMPTVTDF
ncbi:uncharacterized protein NPIL_7361 [Nephila pilipes]|uniref:Spider venom protein n=1 Tax=Nephila pilipes TaxID=299642 RepID=A0A8X6PAT6_NEPPI|nr:uncharacterized protein NPIL_7361 [Nephila pilipes]